MPFPVEYVTSAYYPFHPHYRGRACSAGTACGVGLARAYPTYANNCQQCWPFTKDTCANTYPPFWHGRGYYNPSGTPYGATLLGTSDGTCDARRGCLDPKAASFDKLSVTHCQADCVYRRPRICIPLPSATPEEPCPCDQATATSTAEQNIYGRARGLRRRTVKEEVATSTRDFAWNYSDVGSGVQFEGVGS